MYFLKTRYRYVKHAVVFMFIFLPVIPIIILDLIIEIYHRICFPVYGMPYVNRGEYIAIDRHKLGYLNLKQKIYCVYCGYSNGVMAYWVAIAGKTEEYWCGIKHRPNDAFREPAHHKDFVDYADEQQFIEKYRS